MTSGSRGGTSLLVRGWNSYEWAGASYDATDSAIRIGQTGQVRVEDAFNLAGPAAYLFGAGTRILKNSFNKCFIAGTPVTAVVSLDPESAKPEMVAVSTTSWPMLVPIISVFTVGLLSPVCVQCYRRRRASKRMDRANGRLATRAQDKSAEQAHRAQDTGCDLSQPTIAPAPPRIIAPAQSQDTTHAVAARPATSSVGKPLPITGWMGSPGGCLGCLAGTC